MQKWFNSKGFTTLELMIALSVASMLGLGGAYLLSNLEKNKYVMSSNTDYLSLEKTIEGYLLSPRGCTALRDLPIGSEDVSFQIGDSESMIFKKDAKFGQITIMGFRIASFSAIDPESSTGIAQIELLMLKDGAKNGVKRTFPVAVSVENNIVRDCNAHTKAYNDLLKKACYEIYAMPDTMSCQQVKDALMNLTIEAICQDVYGTLPPLLSINTTVGEGRLRYCDLTRAHAGLDCGAQFAQGFKADGTLNCVANPLPPAPSCTTWGAWYDDTSTQCSGRIFNQRRDCSVGMTAQDSQTATGTKPVSYSYSPGAPADVCVGTQITTTNDCTGAQTFEDGTKADGSCHNACPVTNKSWTVGGVTCSGNTPNVNHGMSYGIAATPNTGTAYYACADGAWGASPDANPAATCTATLGTCYYETGDQFNPCSLGNATIPSTAANCASNCDGTFMCNCVFTP